MSFSNSLMSRCLFAPVVFRSEMFGEAVVQLFRPGFDNVFDGSPKAVLAVRPKASDDRCWRNILRSPKYFKKNNNISRNGKMEDLIAFNRLLPPPSLYKRSNTDIHSPFTTFMGKNISPDNDIRARFGRASKKSYVLAKTLVDLSMLHESHVIG